VPAIFDWSDLGTWGSVFTHVEKDELGNGKIGKILTVNSSRNMIRISEGKEAVVVGLENFIVIEANNKLLVAPLEKEQQIKEWVADLNKI
jgi:mannose-1-phosphate guanylyltransferase